MVSGYEFDRMRPDWASFLATAPPGRCIELPDRGTTYACELPGPPGAPTLVLLHGWTATGALNWLPAFGPLSREFRIIALDQRGHGHGLRASGGFRLADCADDVAAVADVLGIDRVIPVGYSMGGPVAQLVWHRHRDRVAGLVLCATSRNFRGRPWERLLFMAPMGVEPLTHLVPGRVVRGLAAAAGALPLGPPALRQWMARELAGHDPGVLLEAMRAVGRFSSHEWIGGVDVPTAVVVTTRDRVVSPSRQYKLAHSVPGATIHEVAADHGACMTHPGEFVAALLDACRSVAARASRRAAA